MLEALDKLRHRLLVDDHILISFTSEHHRLHILVVIYLVSDVSVPEVGELKIGEADLNLALERVKTLHDVAAG